MIQCSNRFKELYLAGAPVSAKVGTTYMDDDTVIFDDDSIKSLTVSHQLSSDGKFKVGSVSAIALEMTVVASKAIEHAGDLSDDYFVLWFEIDDDGTAECMPVGMFKAERPEVRITNENTFITINAYDGFYWMDQDYADVSAADIYTRMDDDFDCSDLLNATDSSGIPAGGSLLTARSYARPVVGKTARNLLSNAASTLGVNLTMRTGSVAPLMGDSEQVSYGTIDIDECASASLGGCVQHRTVGVSLMYLGEELHYDAEALTPPDGPSGFNPGDEYVPDAAVLELTPECMWNVDELQSAADVTRVDITLRNILMDVGMSTQTLGHGIGWTRDFELSGRGLPWIECRDKFTVTHRTVVDGEVVDCHKTCVPNSVVLTYDGAITMSFSASTDTGTSYQEPYYDQPSQDSSASDAISELEALVMGQNVLWSGASWPTNSQTVTLSEPVSAQKSGIVLVFNNFNSGNKYSYMNSHFIPKQLVELHPGAMHNLVSMGTGTSAVFMAKNVYVYDDHITGIANNNAAFTDSSSDVKVNNSAYALCYVLGV